ncbi:MAG: CTP synthase, partial [Anaerolineales bacterium]
REALFHAALSHGQDLDLRYVSSEALEQGKNWDKLEGIAGVVVPGGFGERGIEGKVATARWARENKVPYFGLCLGLQVMIIELARHALGSDEADSAEFEPDTKHPVIALMPDQEDVVDKGCTMRLGAYPCRLTPGTRAAEAYGVDQVEERHRHRFEVNNAYRDLLSEAGLVFSGLSPDGRLVEIGELADHPFMLGTQFHPEFKSRPIDPHPLFVRFVAAAIERAKK